MYYGRLDFSRHIDYRHIYSGYLSGIAKVKTGDVYIELSASVETYCSDVNYYNRVNTTTTDEKYNSLGSGWSFAFSRIEQLDGANYLKSANGNLYKINITPTVGDSNLEKYSLNDIRLENDNGSYSNGVKSSRYILFYKDGKKEYFADDGRLLAIQDRFGNTIKFEHTIINGVAHISKITDTVNRVINISYENTSTGKKVVITTPDNSKVQYIIEPISGYSGEYKLAKRIDQMNRETVFNYRINSANFSLLSKSYRDTVNHFVNLEEIIYPTKAASKYTYAQATGNLGNQGSRGYFRIKTREDIDKGTVFNKQTFSYVGDYSGYPNYNDPQNLPSNYEYSTDVVDADLTKTTYTFNNSHLKIREDRKEKGTILTNSSIYTYDTNKLLTKEVNRVYNKGTGQYIETAKNYAYDSGRFGNLVGYWNEKNQRDSNNMPNNNEHKTTMTYNAAFHYLTSKEYKANASTTIKEEFVPYSDGKSVEWVRVYENNIKKKESRLLYDSFGNIIENRNYLDDWVNYISQKYSYNDNITSRNGQFNGLYLTKVMVENVINADGVLIDPKAGNNTGTVDEIYKYDWYGNVIEKHDGMGNIYNYTFDKLGRILVEKLPDNSTKSYSYNDSENSLTHTNENANRIKIAYNGLGNIIQVTDMITGKLLESYLYDGKLRLNTKINYGDNDNRTTVIFYDAAGRVKGNEIRNNANQIVYAETTLYEEAADNGKYHKISKTVHGDIESPSITTTAYMDKYGQIEKQGRITGGEEYFDIFKYDYAGNKIEEKSARANAEGWTEPYTAKYEYNYEGKVTKQYNIKGDYIINEYDALGRLKNFTDIKGSKESNRYSTSYEYDALGRLIKQNIPFELRNGAIQYTVTKKYYDRNSNITRERTSNNRAGDPYSFNRIDYKYNNRNMLIEVATFDNEYAVNYTQYYYDKVGNKVRMYTGLSAPITINGLDSVIPSASDNNYSVTKYEYDQFNKLVKMTDALGKIEHYEYDINGDLKGKIDRNGNVHTMTYDIMNRLLRQEVSCADSSANVLTQYAYTLTGNRKSMSSGNLTTNYAYDDLGRLQKEAESNGIVKEYTYDAANNRKTNIITQNGALVSNTSYEYDKMNRLEHVMEGNSLAATYTYDENGNRKSLSYANGNSTEYQYNYANKVVSLINKQETQAISTFSYLYYLDGNKASKTDDAGTTYYTYDGLGRLKNERLADNSTISYWFDDYSNRARMTAASPTGTTTTRYIYDKNNRLIKEEKVANSITDTTCYYYDNNGNQTFKTSEIIRPVSMDDKASYKAYVMGETEDSLAEAYEYDGLNRLSKAIVSDMTISYTYNGNGLRTSKTVNGITTAHVWDGDQMVLELDETGNVSSKYIRGINLLYSDRAGTKNFYMYNAHGDVEQLTDISGNVIKNYDYDAFGVEKNIDSADNNPFRYCGEYFDKETGTIYLRARYYDPSIGRFISEDSYRGKAEDPLSLNLYTYCSGNPVNFIDPTGHWREGDEKYSAQVQTILLQLTLAWHLADNQGDKDAIQKEAARIREKVDSGLGAAFDTIKQWTEAAANEFAWFLGGSFDTLERDYWLTQVQKFDSSISISEKTVLNASMFIIGMLSPSPDDAIKMISKKALKQMGKEVDEAVAKKFFKSITKYAGKQGTNGIKKLSGNGIKGFMYEVKVKGAGGVYRLLGNKTKSGEILWEIFEKTH